ncbi:MAG: hypothetical protein KDA20_12815 [Phycisphaerales bacterium]|nr:hypothetical protein [Phycisphaerales bacterium]
MTATCNHLAPNPRRGCALRRAALAGAASVLAIATTSAAYQMVYVMAVPGPLTFCFAILPYLQPDPCTMQSLPDEDACLRLELQGNGVGGNQTRFDFVNDDSPIAQNVYAVAIAVPDDAGLALAHDGVAHTWEAQIVTRADWDGGVFAFPGSAGVWSPPAPLGTFDSYFGTAANKAAVYWASASSGVGAIPPAAGLEFYAAPMQVTSPEIPATQSFVAFGDGVVVDQYAAPFVSMSAHGLQHDSFTGVELSVEADRKLRTCCLGSTGKDGVCVRLGRAQGWSGQISGPVSLDGGQLIFQSRGRADMLDNIPLMNLSLEGALTPFGQNMIGTVDFTPIGSSASHIELFDPTGALIAEFDSTAPYGMIVTDEGVPSLRVSPRCERGGDKIEVTWKVEEGTTLGLGTTTIIDQLTLTQYPNVERLVVTALGVTSTIEWVSEITMGGHDVGPVTFNSEALQFGDVDVETLGIAQMQGDAPNLAIDNLGSSGQDGVRLHVSRPATDPVTAMSILWDPPTPCAGLPPNCDTESAHIECRSTGDLGGLPPGQELGWLRIAQDTLPGDPNDKSITADYSAAGSSSMQVEVYSNGVQILAIPGMLPGEVARTTAWPKGCGKGKVNLGGQDTACYRACWPNDVSITVPGLATVLGDEIRVLAESPAGPFEGLESFSILGAELFTLHLTSVQVFPATCPGDATGDNAVDLADLNLVLFNFGQHVGTGVGGDVDGDGFVTLADLNLVLFNFGSAC